MPLLSVPPLSVPTLSRSLPRLLLLAGALGLSACGTPFEVELPEAPPRLVVQSLFAADSVLTLGLSRSASSLAPDGPPADPVTDATVEVFEDGAAAGRAVYVPSRGRYVSDVRPRAGRTYRVRIRAPGFDPVEAQDTVPFPTPFSADVVAGNAPAGEDRIDAVTVRFASGPGVGFFGLYGLVEREAAPGEPAQVFPLTFRSSDPLLADGNLTGLVFDFEDPFYQRAVFQVAPPSGPDVAVQLNVRRQAGAPGQITDRLRLATLSQTYYTYARALAVGTGDGAFEGARGLPTNVAGGYGVFAAFAAAEQILP